MPKPSGPVARRSDYFVQRTTHKEVAEIVRQWHYSKGCAKTSTYAHGLFSAKTGKIVGGALWMPPTAGAAKGLAGLYLQSPLRFREVLALSRLVISPSEPQNAASILLGASERLIRAEKNIGLLVTYADQAEGHTGIIYRATNWTYTGETAARDRWLDPFGKIIAIYAAKNRSVAEMVAAGFVRDGKSKKFRFVKVLKGEMP